MWQDAKGEKKTNLEIKEAMTDFETPRLADRIPVGLGKIFVCRKDDLEMKPVALNATSELKVAEPRYGGADHWKMKGFTIEGKAIFTRTSPGMEELLNQWDGRKSNVIIVPNELQLPRKLKKGFRATYRRDTKWKRNAALWRERNQKTFTGSLRQNGNKVTFIGTNP